MTQPLLNKNILITGATGAAGKQSALTLARAGATVILLAPKERSLNKIYDAVAASGAPEPAMVPMDFTQVTADDYFGLAQALSNEFSHLDGIIHAAGHLGSLTPLAHTNPELWRKNLTINLDAPFQLTQALLPLLLQAESRASVLFFEHPAVASGDHAYWGSYAVAKAGLHTLMALFAEEFEAEGKIQFNSIDPVAFNSALRYNAAPEGVEEARPVAALDSHLLTLMDSTTPFTTGQCFTL